MHLWKQHFENLLSKPPKVKHEQIAKNINNQQDIKLRHFTQEELDSVFRKNNKKATGLAETPRIIKDQGIRRHIVRYCNAVYYQITMN